jgi:F0F1-type ATP synthase assembly protein I
MAVAIVLGLMGGAWADEKLGTDPWLALVGLLLGAGVGFRALFRVARLKGDDDE